MRRRIGYIAAGAAVLLGIALVPAVLPADATAAACQDVSYGVDVKKPFLGLIPPIGKQTMAGQLCVPEGAKTIQVMLPGGTYNGSYWNYNNQGASFREAQNQAGYATLVLDRLGSGKSSVPFSLALGATQQAEAVHQVVQQLRPQFTKIIGIGHSIGAATMTIESATYNDMDAVVITGLTHTPNWVNAAPVFTTLQSAALPIFDLLPAGLSLNMLAPPALLPGKLAQAAKEPQFASRHLDPLYLTTQRGTRFTDFHQLADSRLPDAESYDEANRDVFSLPEVTETALIMNQVVGDIVTKHIRIPVLMVEGAQDKNYCLQNKLITALGQDCSSDQAYKNAESKYFSTGDFDAFVVKGYGHSFNFAPNAPQQWHQRFIDWAHSRGF
ncbi:alpha/beta hydrolase [Pseudonocardiaceae bacterium YIM PH 21723]|nr:alpha/beta hydrolase [Pseudonocardiaceae bacterium YIM PH 21723]